jgi:hypothetical protein
VLQIVLLCVLKEAQPTILHIELVPCKPNVVNSVVIVVALVKEQGKNLQGILLSQQFKSQRQSVMQSMNL